MISPCFALGNAAVGACRKRGCWHPWLRSLRQWRYPLLFLRPGTLLPGRWAGGCSWPCTQQESVVSLWVEATSRKVNCTVHHPTCTIPSRWRVQRFRRWAGLGQRLCCYGAGSRWRGLAYTPPLHQALLVPISAACVVQRTVTRCNLVVKACHPLTTRTVGHAQLQQGAPDPHASLPMSCWKATDGDTPLAARSSCRPAAAATRISGSARSAGAAPDGGGCSGAELQVFCSAARSSPASTSSAAFACWC